MAGVGGVLWVLSGWGKWGEGLAEAASNATLGRSASLANDFAVLGKVFLIKKS